MINRRELGQRAIDKAIPEELMGVLPRRWTARTAVVMSEGSVPCQQADVPTKLFIPEGGRGAAIVLVHDLFGPADHLLQRAADLADDGWHVLVPDLYWRTGTAPVPLDDPQAVEKATAAACRCSSEEAIADVRACVEHLRRMASTGGRVAVMGFGFGGGLVYRAASGVEPPTAPDALVSYYPSDLVQIASNIPVVQSPSIHHFGEADLSIPFSEAQRLVSILGQGSDVEFCSWPGAGCHFDTPVDGLHHKLSSEDAWQTTLVWLYEHFPA